MTDAGALPLALSDLVADLTDAGFLDGTVTAGHAFGGDYEAVNVRSALAIARHRLRAHVILVGMGPGSVGTGTSTGYSGLEVGAVLDAAHAAGGDPIIALRVSDADGRDRHQGVSQHSLTALLTATHVSVTVPVPDHRATHACSGPAQGGSGDRVPTPSVRSQPRASRPRRWAAPQSEDPLLFAFACRGRRLRRPCRGSQPPYRPIVSRVVSTVVDEPVELPTPPAKKKHRTRRQLIEWGIVIAAALLTAIVLRVAVVQAFSIPSVSMERTLLVGDRVLVNKLSGGDRPNHGDVVVFERPPGEEAAAIKDLIKRVIGLPGDTVSAEDGHLVLNGHALKEPYLQPGTRTVMDHPVTVPAGRVFVMGDNRTQSRDSRFFGPILIKSIIGHAFVRVWPPNRIGGI